jgi:hypothetical protein
MSVSYGKGAKGKATKLHAEIIRALGYCEHCGSTHILQCAHIISRRYSNTRTDLRNAFCLCASCHRRFTDWPREFSHFISDTWAAELYDSLKDKANLSLKVDWDTRLEFLKDIKKRLDSGMSIRELRELEK